MKKAALLLAIILISALTEKSFCQTPKKVHTFPEEFVGKTITFKNIRYWPILKEFNGYYTVQIDIASSLNDKTEWGFQTGDKIMGVVGKEMAKQMINKDVGGYNEYYYGAVTGTIIKSDKIFGTDYLFVMSKIINHTPDEPNDIKNVFQIVK